VSPNSVQKGELITFEINLKNMGNTRKSFELRTSFDGSILDSRTVTLNPEESTTVSFSWNTSDVEGGKYLVTAKVDPDGNIWETDKTNNVATAFVEVVASTGVAVTLIIVFIIIMTTAVAGTAYAKFRHGASEPLCPVDYAPLKYSRETGQWYCLKCRRIYKLR